jgi:hypothetical protein
MTDNELTLAICDMYRRAMETHRSYDLAIRACITVLKAQIRVWPRLTLGA